MNTSTIYLEKLSKQKTLPVVAQKESRCKPDLKLY